MARSHGESIDIDDNDYPGLKRYFVKIADLTADPRPELFPAQAGKPLRVLSGRLSQSAAGTVNFYSGSSTSEIAYNDVPGAATFDISWLMDRIQTDSGESCEVDSDTAIALDGFVDVFPV